LVKKHVGDRHLANTLKKTNSGIVEQERSVGQVKGT